MKAFLLAAGFGTRLRPLTNTVPKCMVPIGDKPLLAYWFELFEKHGVNEVLINLHYLPDPVKEYCENYPGNNLKITCFYEETLLGSGGTVLANKEWVDGEDFIIAYADNLTNIRLDEMMAMHCQHEPILTMALFETSRPKECGIATLDAENSIIEFTEKPDQPNGNTANAGIYIASANIFDDFESRYPLDFGFDVLPTLVGRMKGYVMQDYLLDIGNLERLEQARQDIKTITF